MAIGAGGFVTGHSSDTSGTTRVVRTDVHGAYLWSNESNRWSQLVTSASMPPTDRVQAGGNEGVFEIAVAPSDRKRIYMAFKGGVYRSDDGGRTFDRSDAGQPSGFRFDPNGEFRHYGPFMAVDPEDPDRVVFGTPEDGIWRSYDGGRHWALSMPNQVSNPASGTLAQNPAPLFWFEPRGSGTARRLWSMVPGIGMQVSAGGAPFAPLTRADVAQPLTLKAGDFAPDGDFFGVDLVGKTAWRYRRGDWTDLSRCCGLPRRRFSAVAVNPRSGQILVLDEGGKVWRSSTGGDSWWPLLHRSRPGDADPPWLWIADQSYFAVGRMQFDPVVPDRLWVDAGTGVYFADVGTNSLWVNWQSESRGIEELVANDVIKPPGQAPLFAAWDFGIHRKEQLDVFSTGYGPKERVLISAQQLAWTPAQPSFVVTNASDARIGCCSQDGDSVLAGYSLDNGRHWTRFVTLPQPPGTESDDPWRMSFGTIAVSAGSIDNIVWEPSFDRAPFFTTDRGIHWQRVVFEGEQLPFTGSHAAFYLHRKTLAADRVTSGVFYLVHSGGGSSAALTGLWVTEDGGKQWRKRYSGEIAPQSQFSAKLRAVPGRAGHLFFTSGVAGVPDTRLRRSVDGGIHWQILNDVDRIDDIGFGKVADGATYSTIFISGRVSSVYGIWRSVDNARSWQRLAEFPIGRLDQVTVIEGDPDIFGRVYLGYKGSGWLYGTPSACAPVADRVSLDSDCNSVDTTGRQREGSASAAGPGVASSLSKMDERK